MMMTDKPGVDNPTCKKCKLFEGCKTPFMRSLGAASPKVLIIGEAPGEDEDLQGIPFIGRSGQLLRSVLKEVGLDLDKDVRFTNIVRCRPPENKITNKAITYCREFALAEVEKYKPEFVFLMGNSPLLGILGEHGITNWHGVKIEREDTSYIPLYHPAFILRNNGEFERWVEAMMISLEGETIGGNAFKRFYPRSISELEEMRSYLAGWPEIAFDLETSTLNAYGEDSLVLAVSFAAGDRAYAFPVYHSQSYWKSSYKGDEIDDVIRIVKSILIDHVGGIIGHNLKFDQMHTYSGLGVFFRGGGDTMLLSHLLDSRSGIHGLKRLAGINLGMYEYDNELIEYAQTHPEANPTQYAGPGAFEYIHEDGTKEIVRIFGSYDNVPLDILLPYAAMDAEATYKLSPKLYNQLSPKQQTLYKQMIMPVSDILCKVQCNGMAIDYYIAERYRKIYAMFRDDMYLELLEDKKVKKLIKDRQYSLDLETGHTVNGNGRELATGKELAKRKPRKRKIFTFNPNSSLQLQLLYYAYYRIPSPGQTKSGADTTSGKALKNLEDRYPILAKVRYYKLLNTMLTRYLGPASSGAWSGVDGRGRTTYNQHGSITGRTSSSQPTNFQNIPTKEKEPGTLLEYLPIKNIFTHSYVDYSATNFIDMFRGGALMSIDYSGMELRVFASLAQCNLMIAIHKSGLDFHRMVAALAMKMIGSGDIIGATSDKKHIAGIERVISKIEKSVRYRYKWTNWTLLYGGSEYTLMGLYGMPEEDAKETVKVYYDTFPEVLEYRKYCVEFARMHGYIESPLGRREYLPYISDRDDKKRKKSEREAINMPTQSSASDTLLCALVPIDAELTRRELAVLPNRDNIRSVKIVNTVHDSAVLDTPAEFIDPTAELCIDVMENIKDVWAPKYLPGIDFSWLLAPLKADVEVGSHYGSEMSIEKWKEHFRWIDPYTTVRKYTKLSKSLSI